MTTSRLLAVLLGGGLALSAIALMMPRYSDPDWEDPFHRELPPAAEREKFNRDWYEARQEASTARRSVEDAGAGLVLLSISLASLIALQREESVGTCSPRSPLHWFLWGAGASLLFTLGFVADLMACFARGDFPWWADSLGIPLVAAPVLLLTGLLGSAVMAGVAADLGPHPVPISPIVRPPLWLSLPLALPAVLVAFLLLLCVAFSPAYVPALLGTTYLALSMQAIAVARARGSRPN